VDYARTRELVGELRSLARGAIHPYGPDEGLLPFLRNQLELRLRRA
jgi:hypothetical protein